MSLRVTVREHAAVYMFVTDMSSDIDGKLTQTETECKLNNMYVVM